MPLSTFAANAVLNKLLRNVNFTVSNVFVSLHTGEPGLTGVNEAAGGSYARAAATFGAAASGSCSNSAIIDIVSPGAVLSHFGVWDAASSGNFLWGGPLLGSRIPFVADAGDDVLIAMAHGLATNDRVQLRIDYAGTTPGGLSLTTVYWVIDATTDTFRVSLTQGGAAVAISSDGSGIAREVAPRDTVVGETLRFGVGDLVLQA
jgi:hypothetical protein